MKHLYAGVIAVICLAACQPLTPMMNGCPAGSCCYVGPAAEDELMRQRSVVYGQRTDQTTVTSNLDPCGYHGESCGGGMCCWEGYVCGAPKK